MKTNREKELAAYAKFREEYPPSAEMLAVYDTALRDIIELMVPTSASSIANGTPGINLSLKDPSAYAVAMVSVRAALGGPVILAAKRLVDKCASEGGSDKDLGDELSELAAAVAIYRKHAG